MPEAPEKTKKDPRIFSTVSVAGYDILHKYGLSNLENPDKMITKKGLAYLDEVERDTHLASQLATRRQRLIKKGWRIAPHVKPGGQVTAQAATVAQFIEDQLRQMRGAFEKDIEGMLDAVGKGFSLTEKIFAPITRGKWQGKTGLEQLRHRPAKYFSFKFDKWARWQIMQVDPVGALKAPLPPEKFVHVIHGPNDENPYGQGVSSLCAFWTWLKKNEAKFWAIFSERFGMPLGKVTMPRKSTPEEQDKVDEILDALQRESGIRVPEGFQVEFLEATRRGDVGYDNFIDRCNKEISKMVLGQTLGSEEGHRGQGSYALGQTHAQIMEDYLAFDSLMTAEAINEQIIQQLVWFNWLDVGLRGEWPRFEWMGVDIGALVTLSQSVDNLVRNGFSIPTSWVHTATGIPIPKEGEPVLKSQAPAGSSPSTPGTGRPDNRAFEDLGVPFEEMNPDQQAQLREIERIYRRYETLTTEKYAELAESLKKKAQT